MTCSHQMQAAPTAHPMNCSSPRLHGARQGLHCGSPTAWLPCALTSVEGFPHTICSIPLPSLPHSLALAVKEAAAADDLWHAAEHARYC